MRVFSLVFLILGCFLGAGFVSGKEIATYFSCYGNNSICGIIILSILIFLLLTFFLVLSNKVESFNHFSNKYFGKYSELLNFLFSFSMLIFIGSMFAGNFTLAKTLNLNKWLFILFTIVLTFIFVNGNRKFISVVNWLLIPIVIGVLIYLTLPDRWSIGGEGDIVISSISSIGYGFLNIVPVGVFLLDINGKRKLAKKEIFLTSLITSIIVLVLLLFYNNAIILNDIGNEDLPILKLANSAFVKYLSIVALYVGMLTTLVSCVYVLTNYINKYVNGYKRSTMLSLFLGLVISFFGFNNIVSYVYILISLIGIYIVFFVLIKEKRNLKNQVS